MAIIETDDPEHLRLQTAGGILLPLLGLPFLILGSLAGLGMFARLLGFLPGPMGVVRNIVSLGLAGLFTAIGAALVFGRSGYEFDRRNGVVVSWWRFLCWHSATEFNLSEFGSLTLEKYWNTSKHGPDWLYRVHLCPNDGQLDPLELGSQVHEQVARKNVARLSEFLRLAVVETKTEQV